MADHVVPTVAPLSAHAQTPLASRGRRPGYCSKGRAGGVFVPREGQQSVDLILPVRRPVGIDS